MGWYPNKEGGRFRGDDKILMKIHFRSGSGSIECRKHRNGQSKAYIFEVTHFTGMNWMGWDSTVLSW